MRKMLWKSRGVSVVLVLATWVSIAPAQITFYEHEGFKGRFFTTPKRLGNLERSGFNDSASSAVVDQRTWEVCEDARYRGHCRVLRQGRYPSLMAMGLTRPIASLRRVGLDEPVSDERYAPWPVPASALAAPCDPLARPRGALATCAVCIRWDAAGRWIFQPAVFSIVKPTGQFVHMRPLAGDESLQQLAQCRRSVVYTHDKLVAAVDDSVFGCQVGFDQGRQIQPTVVGGMAWAIYRIGGVAGHAAQANDMPRQPVHVLQIPRGVRQWHFGISQGDKARCTHWTLVVVQHARQFGGKGFIEPPNELLRSENDAGLCGVGWFPERLVHQCMCDHVWPR